MNPDSIKLPPHMQPKTNTALGSFCRFTKSTTSAFN